MKVEQPIGLYLGYPFDQLLDRNCDLEYWKESRRTKGKAFTPAIKLPRGRHPGTGNIIITGPPGSGKSTLALQWAYKCAFRADNSSNAAYLSFEQTVDEVVQKAALFGWHDWVRPMNLFTSGPGLADPDAAAISLMQLLLGRTRPDEPLGDVEARLAQANKVGEVDSADDSGNHTRRVFLFSLSPRPITDTVSHEEFFSRRYKQLECLLAAAHCLSSQLSKGTESTKDLRAALAKGNQPNRPYTDYRPPQFVMLPVIVIDSLNMLGVRPLARGEMHSLFALFRKYQRTGIFVVESTQETPFDSTMADVVVSLSQLKDRGYFVQHFEIEKSRYFNQINGAHPYKSFSRHPNDEVLPLLPRLAFEDRPKPPRNGIIVFPSLHYVVLRTEPADKIRPNSADLNHLDRFGIDAFRTILPPQPRQSAITIEGPSGTYKSSFALNFLATGLQLGESGLLIRLSDVPLLQAQPPSSSLADRRLSQELAEGFPLISRDDIQSPKLLYECLSTSTPFSNYVWETLAARVHTRKILQARGLDHLKQALADCLNAITPESFIEVDDTLLNGIRLHPDTEGLRKEAHRNKDVCRVLKRRLLEDAFPGCLRSSKPFRWSHWARYLGEEARYSEFSRADFTDLPSLAARLKQPKPEDKVSEFLRSRMSRTREALRNYQVPGTNDEALVKALIDDLNNIIGGNSIYTERRFKGVTLRTATVQLIGQSPEGKARAWLNRLLLEDAYPEIAKSAGGLWSNLFPRHKAAIALWRRLEPGAAFPEGDPPEPTLFELDLKGGALLPEEFVDLIRAILNQRQDEYRIRRVVLDDVGQIGVSYPFLSHSTTTGESFLPAFVHIMRNAGVDLVMVATTTGLPQGDEMVHRACSLADAVLSCDFCDVFGERHIIVRRKGILAGKASGSKRGETPDHVPGVVRLRDGSEQRPDVFVVDRAYLSGLVGFETGHIHRPGLLIYVFEENQPIHGQYNDEMLTMLRAAFAAGPNRDDPERHDAGQDQTRRARQNDSMRVELVPFGASKSEAIHGAVMSFREQEKPLERTVLFTVDEFGAPVREPHSVKDQWVATPPGHTLEWHDFLLSQSQKHAFGTDNEKREWPGYLWPYYSNLLLLAYRKDHLAQGHRFAWLKSRRPPSWTAVLELAEHLCPNHSANEENHPNHSNDDSRPRINRAFWIDRSAAETLTCLILDALHVAHGLDGFKFLDGQRTPKGLTAEDNEVRAVATLLSYTFQSPVPNVELNPGDAGVYLCWYSQLRELIDRHPALAPHLDVCALPGRGFRGDWFAGIVRGSVSPDLGQRVIGTLCGLAEDRKRYERGVGLPARTLFYEKEFYAWPRSDHLTLADLKDIYLNASSRGDIADYHAIRSDIFEIVRQLVPLPGQGPSTYDVGKLLRQVDIGRLFAQVRSLRSAGTSAIRAGQAHLCSPAGNPEAHQKKPSRGGTNPRPRKRRNVK